MDVNGTADPVRFGSRGRSPAACGVALAVAALASGCEAGRPPTPGQEVALPDSVTRYAFDAPDAGVLLPPELVEVSGITLWERNRLAAVQDEDGLLFILDPAVGAVVERIPFAGRGDYEDLRRVDSTVFVLRSDGGLFPVPVADPAEATREELALPRGCDAEGLAVDPRGQRLLIACKEASAAGVRSVHAWSLETRALEPNAVFEIDWRAVTNAPALDGRRINRFLAFKPSALDVHPVTGHWYVLSSVQRTILVLDAAFRPVGRWTLPARLFRQPEGMAFGPDGTLWIANEGAGAAATLLRFDPVLSIR